MLRGVWIEHTSPSVSGKCSTTELTAHANRGRINSQICATWQAQNCPAQNCPASRRGRNLALPPYRVRSARFLKTLHPVPLPIRLGEGGLQAASGNKCV